MFVTGLKTAFSEVFQCFSVISCPQSTDSLLQICTRMFDVYVILIYVSVLSTYNRSEVI